MRGTGAGRLVVASEGPVMGLEPRGRADQGQARGQPAVAGEEPMERPKPKVKSFEIDKRLMYQAWEKVRANHGAPGVDAVSIGQFQRAGEGQPLQAVEPDVLGELLPGAGAGGGDTERSWDRACVSSGCRTSADRVAQTAAAMLLEAALEPIFHPDSYGYRPGRSAHDALAVCRRRCWETGLGDRL